MDFDISKENIQPLRGGRNASQLGVALQAQTDMDHQRELLQQQSEFERQIATYTGDDPLELWYQYISWVEQSYPKQGHEGNLGALLERCLCLFEKDPRYRNDRRLCKLFIKYIDQHQNPLELYHMMYASELCRGCADMYRAWAYYYEATGDFQNAHIIFEYAKKELAQPFSDILRAHESLVLAAGRHMIYGPNERDLSEKRQALTSLQTFKPGQVGSVRSAASENPLTLGAPIAGRSNACIPVYEDKGQEVKGAEAGPISIIAAAKRQEVPKENTLKPGQWTTVVLKSKSGQRNCGGNPDRASIPIYEDQEEGLKGAECSSFVSTGQELPTDKQELGKLKPLVQGSGPDLVSILEGRKRTNDFVSKTFENYSDWIVSLTIPEPKDDRIIPMYPKAKVYSEVNTEYSLEELRAVRYLPAKSEPVQNLSYHASLQEQMSYQHNEQTQAPAFCIWDSPQNTEKNERSMLNFDLWNSSKHEASAVSLNVRKSPVRKFSIYEQSTLALQEQIEPKGSAMKTPFKNLNAEELAETGSRGGMDVAAAAPVDSAKRLPLYDDDSSSSFDNITESVNFNDLTCNTQMFGFNLNVMQVSTPQSKQPFGANIEANAAKLTPKQLFAEQTLKGEGDKVEKNLSTIFEETKSYGSSSSSSNAATKSSLFGSNFKQNTMAKISEEHTSYLAQNLMVNAALRSSSLGELMDFDQHASPAVPSMQKPTPEQVVPAPTKITPLDVVPSDPFKQSLIEMLLRRVNFPGPHRHGYCYLSSIPKLVVRKEVVNLGLDKYVIEKQLGKGTYGTVFRGIDLRTGNPVAVKFQRPANRWEFYICRELRSRLAQHPLRERFMDVTIGYFSDQASVLISEFMPCGSLLSVANTVKQKSGRPMKESLCIHFCLEMLKVVQAMHEVKIIHADIKPDNFLVQLTMNDAIVLQLIDFGCSIDMSLFPPNASFTRKVTTEDFICCEMRDNRPWNYHTDLFCIAATAHVLLFDKYMQLRKNDGHWSILNRLPRYARLDLWNMFFSTLLNQQEGPANSAALQAMLEDSLNHKFDDYHNELRFLTNLLKNR
ncbi:mitotic checkpoint serine/threonine-protein kinase BUB1 beta [Tribolium castaneum]|uniref:Budding uninhibited by benzimidazoles 1 n=1 Tax=Tribolium castaneum TaxID=7070 RepID=D6WN27_TRICA|nr:PREDICTED: mitotic checkpoint serine/threonine-protein kinase BUB1 beta [Tribolium castaneum]EFA04692.2 budding uninhibited by benzimidazoles 1 [Tribolium castaneum]|eukprot:XP_008194278.1 PREDICTED: mitotic checkpoint serine/threonine-protein kinase BUB1 beta [Tribolium castaneum]